LWRERDSHLLCRRATARRDAHPDDVISTSLYCRRRPRYDDSSRPVILQASSLPSGRARADAPPAAATQRTVGRDGRTSSGILMTI